MEPLPWTTLEVNFAVWNLTFILPEMLCVIYDISTHESEFRKAHVACNFNCLFENEGLLKVTDSDVDVNVVMTRKRYKMESLLLQTTNRKWYIACLIVAIPMTLRDLWFLSRDAMLPRYMLSSCVCRSVCPSVPLSVCRMPALYQNKTAKHTIAYTTPYDSPCGASDARVIAIIACLSVCVSGTLVLWRQNSLVDDPHLPPEICA